MSFIGDLEHLPIVDVIQLLHTARKSGTLIVRSGKGEAQLVFCEGFIVSANHANNSVRIGNILVKMGAIGQETLDRALTDQRNAGESRQTLIATLIEGGMVEPDAAYKGLETLIEMTIVEVLTWSTGTFELDVDNLIISDEYRYFPEKLQKDIYLNTQSVLMDALRIYDESMRDGNIAEATFADEPPVDVPVSAPPPAAQKVAAPEISADILGLADIDELVPKVQPVFIGVREEDPTEPHRQKLRKELADIPAVEQERLYSFLAAVSAPADIGQTPQNGPPLAVIIFSHSEIMSHALTTVCKHEGMFVFATDDEQNLDMIIDQSITRKLVPILILDQPQQQAEGIALLQQKRSVCPELTILQLATANQYLFTLQALREGARAVLPRPDRQGSPETFVDELLLFLGATCRYLHNSFDSENSLVIREYVQSSSALSRLSEPAEIAMLLLQFAGAICDRALTLVVGRDGLISERGIGIGQPRNAGPSLPDKITIPLDRQSPFRDAVERGARYFDKADSPLFQDCLFASIGAPVADPVLLLPIKRMGRVIALIYGDFRLSAATPLQLELLDTLTRQAELVLDTTFYKSRLKRSAPTA